MRRPIRELLLSPVELGYVGAVAGGLVLLGNASLLLERTGLIGSANTISRLLTAQLDKPRQALGILDKFSFTGNVVNLIIWGAAGLLIYSILQTVVRSLRIFTFHRDFSTGYVHPHYFSREGYWRQIVLESLTGFVLLVSLVIGLSLYLFLALPRSINYMLYFVVHPSLTRLQYPILSLSTAFVGTTVAYLLVKLVVNHHRAVVAADISAPTPSN